MNAGDLTYLHNCFNAVLYGTADKIRQPLLSNGIDIKKLFCKTGTAERQNGTGNASSSFIICNKQYCIGIELKDQIPENKENYSAKDLFIELIPILKKYTLL